jgi:hypothetical protein
MKLEFIELVNEDLKLDLVLSPASTITIPTGVAF